PQYLWHTNRLSENGASILFADLNDDGEQNEVLFSGDKIYAFDSEGNLLWSSTGKVITAFDADNDGYINDLLVDVNGRIGVMDKYGNLIWSYPSGGWYDRKAVIGDFDNDGREDDIAFERHWWTNRHNDMIYVYKTDDGKHWTELWSKVTSPGGWPPVSQIEKGDVNRDGKTDICIRKGRSWNGKDALICYDGTNGDILFKASSTSQGYLKYPGYFLIIDWDEDGNDEIIVGTDGTISGWKFKNNEIGKEYSDNDAFWHSSGFSGNVRKMLPVDLDNDGKENEILVLTTRNEILAFNITSIVWKLSNTDMDEITDIQRGDIDNNGEDEIVLAGRKNNNAALIILNRKGDAIASYFPQLPAITSIGTLKDLNKNGIKELPISCNNGKSYIFSFAKCSIKFSDENKEAVMEWDEEIGLWEYKRKFSEAGNYNWEVSCWQIGYQPQTKTSTINIIKDIYPPGNVKNLHATYISDDEIIWEWENPDDEDFMYVMVYLNGKFVLNTTETSYHASKLEDNTQYTILLKSVDNANNINENAGKSTVTTLHFNAGLDIWDETDLRANNMIRKGTNNNVTFFAKYIDKSSKMPIENAECWISFTDGKFKMKYEKGVYKYTRKFSNEGYYTWNVTCSASGYDTRSKTNKITIYYWVWPSEREIYQDNLNPNTTIWRLMHRDTEGGGIEYYTSHCYSGDGSKMVIRYKWSIPLILNADGSYITQILKDLRTFGGGVLNKDGNVMYYVDYSEAQIYKIDLITLEKTQLTKNHCGVSESWRIRMGELNPSGTKIAYTLQGLDGICIVNTDGSYEKTYFYGDTQQFNSVDDYKLYLASSGKLLTLDEKNNIVKIEQFKKASHTAYHHDFIAGSEGGKVKVWYFNGTVKVFEGYGNGEYYVSDSLDYPLIVGTSYTWDSWCLPETCDWLANEGKGVTDCNIIRQHCNWHDVYKKCGKTFGNLSWIRIYDPNTDPPSWYNLADSLNSYTCGDHADTNAIFSPDGTKVAFNSDRRAPHIIRLRSPDKSIDCHLVDEEEWDRCDIHEENLHVAIVRKPDRPQGLTLSKTENGYLLKWQPGTHHKEIEKYNIYFSDNGIDYKKIAAVPKDTLSFLDRNCSGTCYYAVTAQEWSGLESEYSNEVSTSYTEDLNNDGIVNIFDLVIVAKRYGAKPTNPNWNSKFDLEKDNRIDEKDLLRVVERLRFIRRMRRKRHG
ncbi:MAG: hypothetical protein DRP03_03750, partial [Candidatus Aenigmatarchaeota archaeon]